MRIRAAVLDCMDAVPPYVMSKSLRITEVELDPPGRGEVLVRIVAAGLGRRVMGRCAATAPVTRPGPPPIKHPL